MGPRFDEVVVVLGGGGGGPNSEGRESRAVEVSLDPGPLSDDASICAAAQRTSAATNNPHPMSRQVLIYTTVLLTDQNFSSDISMCWSMDRSKNESNKRVT